MGSTILLLLFMAAVCCATPSNDDDDDNDAVLNTTFTLENPEPNWFKISFPRDCEGVNSCLLQFSCLTTRCSDGCVELEGGGGSKHSASALNSMQEGEQMNSTSVTRRH